LNESKKHVAAHKKYNSQDPTKESSSFSPFISIFPKYHIWKRRLLEFILSSLDHEFIGAAGMLK